MNKYFINPYLFFIINNGKIICWDYKHHQQFEIGKEYFSQLVKVSSQKYSSYVDDDLTKTTLITTLSHSDHWGWDILSKIYHFGTQITKNHKFTKNSDTFASEYLNMSENIVKSLPTQSLQKKGHIIFLPIPKLDKLKQINLMTALRERKTCRSFTKKNISLQVLSTLLKVVFAEVRNDINEYKRYNCEQIGIRKSSPSGGGLNSVEAYLLVLHVSGLTNGIYYYDYTSHNLVRIKKVNLEKKISNLLCGQYYAKDLSIGVFLTSRFDKLWNKYPHSRAYRVALLDAGHISQTFQLVSTALGLNPWLTASFVDEDVINLLRIDSTKEQPLFFVGAGTGPKSVLDPITKRLLLK